MTKDDIAHASMVAAQNSADWAFWTMVATMATVCVSLGTLWLAYSALDSWKEQERLKIKMELKRATLELRFALENMPETYWYYQVNLARDKLQRYPDVANRIGDDSQIFFLKKAVADAYAETSKAWIMCEHLFAGSLAENNWRDFKSEYLTYITRGGNKEKLSKLIDLICKELKVI